MTSALLLLAPLLVGGAEFETPVPVTAGGEAISSMYFPTPVLFDVDQDDQKELVVGDLMGNVWVAEHEAGASDVAWAKTTHVQAEGKPLKLNNW